MKVCFTSGRITAYQEQGMKVALDDLGAGHSTVSVLKELRPDYVKIDRKIVSFCDEDEEKQNMIKQIVQISKEIEQKVSKEKKRQILHFITEYSLHKATISVNLYQRKS